MSCCPAFQFLRNPPQSPPYVYAPRFIAPVSTLTYLAAGSRVSTLPRSDHRVLRCHRPNGCVLAPTSACPRLQAHGRYRSFNNHETPLMRSARNASVRVIVTMLSAGMVDQTTTVALQVLDPDQKEERYILCFMKIARLYIHNLFLFREPVRGTESQRHPSNVHD